MKSKNLKWLLFLTIALSGCAHNYRDDFLADAKKEGWNEGEQKTALEYSYRLLLLEKAEAGDYKIKYSILRTKEVREKIDEALRDVNQLLSYKNEADTKFVDRFKLRKSLERSEQILKAQRDRLRTHELYGQFLSLTSGIPEEYSENQIREKITGYNQKIFISTDLPKAFPFQIESIEEAKKRGVLKEIERGQLSLYRKFDRQEQNPAKADDPNDLVWKSKSIDLEIINYKILENSDVENPKTNEGNYLEGYRIIKGKKEALPALRVFYPNDDDPGVMLLDLDKEDEAGFGMPDLIGPMPDNLSVAELFQENNLLELLFQEKKEQRRVPPKTKPLFVEIARIQEKLNELWETAPNENGWRVPFKYQDELRNNYNVNLVFAKLERSTDTANGIYKQIKYLKKIWTAGRQRLPSMGRVVEYYQMKPPYNERNLIQAEIDRLNAKRISLVFENGSEDGGVVVPRPNKFIENSPIMIDYTEGNKRWRIKKDSDSKVFNKRKEISRSLEEKTGKHEEE